jgi:flagellin-like protein
MNKKGISPVIATVLLIGIVVVLATIIFIWARSFIDESAVKNGRAVGLTCANVEFQWRVVLMSASCNNDPSIEINNIGNIPIYGLVLKKYDENVGSLDILLDKPFDGGTLTIGKSVEECITSSQNIMSGDEFIAIPKLLAESSSGQKISYTCPETDGTLINFS